MCIEVGGARNRQLARRRRLRRRTRRWPSSMSGDPMETAPSEQIAPEAVSTLFTLLRSSHCGRRPFPFGPPPIFSRKRGGPAHAKASFRMISRPYCRSHKRLIGAYTLRRAVTLLIGPISGLSDIHTLAVQTAARLGASACRRARGLTACHHTERWAVVQPHMSHSAITIPIFTRG